MPADRRAGRIFRDQDLRQIRQRKTGSRLNLAVHFEQIIRDRAGRQRMVEPVFGQIKQERGFRQFLLRGKENVKAEWALVCLTHNILRLYAAQYPC